jgi:hypothetical protein
MMIANFIAYSKGVRLNDISLDDISEVIKHEDTCILKPDGKLPSTKKE